VPGPQALGAQAGPPIGVNLGPEAADRGTDGHGQQDRRPARPSVLLTMSISPPIPRF